MAYTITTIHKFLFGPSHMHNALNRAAVISLCTKQSPHRGPGAPRKICYKYLFKRNDQFLKSREPRTQNKAAFLVRDEKQEPRYNYIA